MVWIQRSSEHLLNPHLISGQLRAKGAITAIDASPKVTSDVDLPPARDRGIFLTLGQWLLRPTES